MGVPENALRRVVPALLSAVALVVGLAVAPAQAVFPGRDGKVAFERGGNVWTGWENGSGVWRERKLTSDGKSRNPQWSADGKRIAFNTRDGNIVTMNQWGDARKVVVRGGSYQPAFSPRLPAGGVKIAYVKVPKGGHGDIWTVGAWGGKSKRITWDGAKSCGMSRPQWSPDGSSLVFIKTIKRQGHCAESRVIVMDLNSKQRNVVPRMATLPNGEKENLFPGSRVMPSFSPNGSRVLVDFVGWCVQFLVWYDLTTNKLEKIEDILGIACEGGNIVVHAGLTPSGGVWRVSTALEGGEHLSYSGGNASNWSVSPNSGWENVVVQPLP